MKKIIYVIFLSVLISFVGCDKESDSNIKDDNEIIELRDNFNADEFKDAIIGKWQSVWENDGVENVIFLELNEINEAKIILNMDQINYDYQGTYKVDFLRQPQEGYLTLGEITITAQQKTITLSNVYFGLHNGLSATKMYLRIGESPHGVLDRVK